MGLVNRVKFYWLIALIVSGLYQATSIVLVDFGLTDADLDLLLWALDCSPKVKARIELIDLSNTRVRNPKDEAQRVNTLAKAIFRDFPALKTLILDKNQLVKLSVIGSSSIYKLSVSINKLKEILGLGQLSELHVLDVYGNKFETINTNRHLFLQQLDAAANRLASIDLSNNVQLKRADLEDNPLKTIRFNNNPATKIRYNETTLDTATKLSIQRMQAVQNTPTVVANIDSLYRPISTNPNIQLSAAVMNAYFYRIVRERANELNQMLSEARKTYICLMSISRSMEPMNAFKIVDYLFSDNVNTYLTDSLQELKTTTGAGNQHTEENNHLLDDFVENELETKMLSRLAKARQLFFSTSLEKARASFISRTVTTSSTQSLKM